MERPPAEFGADLAWGCEGSNFDSVWGDEYVPGLCRSDAIEVCGCVWDAYECTGDFCPEPGIDDTGDGTSDTGDETGDGTSGTDTGTDTGMDTGTDSTAGMDTGTDSTGMMDTGTDTTGMGDTTGGN